MIKIAILGASRYIHLNPIECGLVKDLRKYPWSSYSYNELFADSPFRIVDRVEIVRLIGETEKEKDAYYHFLLEGIESMGDLKSEYKFERDIEGKPKFNTLSQKNTCDERSRYETI